MEGFDNTDPDLEIMASMWFILKVVVLLKCNLSSNHSCLTYTFLRLYDRRFVLSFSSTINLCHTFIRAARPFVSRTLVLHIHLHRNYGTSYIQRHSCRPGLAQCRPKCLFYQSFDRRLRQLCEQSQFFGPVDKW